MAQEQNYQVNYTINVDASTGTKQLSEFSKAIGSLIMSKNTMDLTVNNIKTMMTKIDKLFTTKSGKRRSYTYKLHIDTGSTEEKLERIKKLLGEIGEMSKNFNLVINAGQPLDAKVLKKNAQKLIEKNAVEKQQIEIEKTAASSVQSMMDTQRRITKVIGKINAALESLYRGREITVKTEVAKERLLEILSLLNQIKGASKMTLGMQMGSPGLSGSGNPGIVVPYAPQNKLPDKALQRVQEKIYTAQQMYQLKRKENAADFDEKLRQKRILQSDKEAEQQRRNATQAAEWTRRQEYLEEKRTLCEKQRAVEKKERQDAAARRKALQDKERERKQTAMQSIQMMQREQTAVNTLNRSKRRAAINRIQYSKAPSLRNLPFVSMLNAYMGYSLMRTELTKAIEYANIMESAHSILRVADDDLSTFETRFDKMARSVRKIGVDTKFTAVEIAGAVKFLSMAGMNIDTINKSIRPIVNLALIGDNDVSYIADLATNIMAGYDIRNESMNSVADIIASTVSRSNVNIVEMAESYKMAAGYLRTAGVQFSEASAAIGLLGNMGLKGTLAGTSLRAMSTRFAKPTKEAQGALDRLGIRFTEMRDVYGKSVERLRPIADIFEDLNKKGASMADIQSIFGKIAGNAAMVFMLNYDKLRELTSQNRASYGISSELASVKQETTKGLWSQVTSQLTESFMGGYEILEPAIRSTLRSFLDKFKAPEFTRGLVSIGQALLDILSIVGNIGAWFTRNYYWIEPLVFTSFVSTRLFKLAGMLTNLGVALGYVGKQAAATSSLELIQSLTGLKGIGKLSYANKRTIVSALRSAGIGGKGVMKQALFSMGGSSGTREVLRSLFATQVATGSGLTGAAASLSAIGTGAVAATAGITALVGALGWIAYKTWKIKEAKDAMQEELAKNEKYRYPSIEALYESLKKTYQQAVDTKDAINKITEGRTIEEASGQSTGIFTGNWWRSYFSMLASSRGIGYGYGMGANTNDIYSPGDAYQDDVRAAIRTIARRDSQSRINAAFAKLGKQSTAVEVRAFMQNIQNLYGQEEGSLDKTLWTTDKNGKIWYVKGLGEMAEAKAAKTVDYAQYQNTVTVPEITRAAEVYLGAISSQSGAQGFMQTGGFNFNLLSEKGFSLDSTGRWRQKVLGPQATDKEREDQLAGFEIVRDALIRFLSSARNTLGGSAEAAENILRVAGFTPDLYSNEAGNNDTQPFNANRITNTGLDDGGAGGNYSGTGKLSSAAPKQVIVNISNLMSIGTIDLLKSPEGQRGEIQNLKEELTQVLIDVVHDFDATWNG